MKTAMQELVDTLEIRYKIIKDAGLHSEASTIKMTIGDAKILLEKEKKQHETTFHRGINIGALNPELDIEGRKESAKHYYESTFVHLNNQNK